jgi:hypothetical protein
MGKRVTDLSVEELDRLAAEAWSDAANEALAKGLSVTGSRDGRRYRYHPTGRIDDLGPLAVKSAAADRPKFETVNLDVSTFEMPKFEMPNFDMPNFDMPKGELPAAFREVAERGISLKILELARANTDAAFYFAGKVMEAKTLSEVLELTSAHARSMRH